MNQQNVKSHLQNQQFQGFKFACDPTQSRGRLMNEQASATRNAFQRDRDRIIHSAAFRRLKDKTQVFIYDEGDHYRTRLTHTIEVSQIARSLARALNVNEDLAEALALAHDLGHPPFGHAGERALDECMRDWGGFDHNAQSLRVVTKLEKRYAQFDGLNLTWETLEGLVKHNGPLTDKTGAPLARYGEALPAAITKYARDHDLWLWSYPSLEAQAAAIADDIAYNAADFDDGLRAGLITLEDASSVPFIAKLIMEVDALYPNLEEQRRRYEVTRRVITNLIEDVVFESRSRISALQGQGADAVRHSDKMLVSFSPAMYAEEQALKTYLRSRLYRAERVMSTMRLAEKAVKTLFAHYIQNPDHLPTEWRIGLVEGHQNRFTRRVCDYIAGMTDRYALQDLARLTNDKVELG